MKTAMNSARILVVVIAVTSAYFSPAYGQAGSLDATFDGDGIVTTPIGNLYEGAYQVMIQPDGKIIAAGYSNSGTASLFDYDFALARYNSDGSLDTSFSSDGKVTTDFGSINDYATGAMLQPDGKIVVAGRTYINGNFNYGCAVARYNSDGSPDNTFDGDGKATHDIGPYDEYMFECTVQPDGKILVSGYTFNGSQNVFVVLRFAAAGGLDNTFGSAGVAMVSFPGHEARGIDITLLSNGKILVIGRTYVSSTAMTSDFALAQLNTNGTLDNSFGTGGMVLTDFSGMDDYGETCIVQPDGKIIAAGFTGDILATTRFAMVRYTSAGIVDSTFGINGRVTTAFTTHDECFAIALQPDLKILLAGRVFNGYNDFGIARYHSNGVLDSTFDADGKVVVPISGIHDEAFSVAVQADGKIVVGGRSESSNDDFALVRLNGDMPTGNTDLLSKPLAGVYLFPNPADDVITIQNIFPSSGKTMVKIYDVSGKLVHVSAVHTQVQYQVSIEHIGTGIFFCEVSDGDQRKTLLFSKMK